jgi:hypothetical protein
MSKISEPYGRVRSALRRHQRVHRSSFFCFSEFSVHHSCITPRLPLSGVPVGMEYSENEAFDTENAARGLVPRA